MHVCTYRGRDAIPSLENKLNDLILLSLFLLESARGVTRMRMRTLRRVYVCLCARMLGQEVTKVFTSSSLQLTRHGNEAVSKLWASCVLLEIDCSYITTFLVEFFCSSVSRLQAGDGDCWEETSSWVWSTYDRQNHKPSSHLSTKHSNNNTKLPKAIRM